MRFGVQRINGKPYFVGGMELSLDGSAARPSKAFLSDPAKGFYSSGANEIGIAIAGIKQGYLSNAGTGLRIGNGQSSGTRLDLFDAGGLTLTTSSNSDLTLDTNGSGRLFGKIGGVEAYRVNASSRFLLGTGGTDYATGRFQLVTGTTLADGAGFGADTSLWRGGAGTLHLGASAVSTAATLSVFYGNGAGTPTQAGYFGAAGGAGQLATNAVAGDTVLRGQGALRLCAGGATEAIVIDANLHSAFSGKIISKAYTVATLPAGTQGARAHVTDSNTAYTAGIGAVVAGGGANVVPVFYDGANWRIG